MQESPTESDLETESPDAATTSAADTTAALPRHINSTDATAGQPLVARVTARKLELEALLAALPLEDINVRGDIGLALSMISELLTGDLDNVPPVVGVDMNRWLERTKHIAERNLPSGHAADKADDADNADVTTPDLASP